MFYLEMWGFFSPPPPMARNTLFPYKPLSWSGQVSRKVLVMLCVEELLCSQTYRAFWQRVAESSFPLPFCLVLHTVQYVSIMLIFKVDFRRHSGFLHCVTNKGGAILNAKKAVGSLAPYSSFLVRVSRTGFCTGCLEGLWKSVIVFSKAASDSVETIMSPKLLLKCILTA